MLFSTLQNDEKKWEKRKSTWRTRRERMNKRKRRKGREA
jgi:hypothetical protein